MDVWSSSGCFCLKVHCSKEFFFVWHVLTWNKYLQIFEEEKEIFSDIVQPNQTISTVAHFYRLVF